MRSSIVIAIYNYVREHLTGHGIGNYYLVKKITSFFLSQAHIKFAEVQGSKMYLHPIGLSVHLAVNGVHEKIETDYVKNEIKEGDVVVDIGANIGYYTLLFSKLVGKKGKVFAFEPEPVNFQLLKKNVEINGCQNIILENKIVSNKNGKAKLYISEQGPGKHKIYPTQNDEENLIFVDSVKLDDYFKDLDIIKNISFIKIDVEGSELGVIKGMELLLKVIKKLKIQLEFSSFLIQQYGAKQEELLKLLEDYGFKIYFVNNENQRIEKVENTKFLKQQLEKRHVATNLICVRK